MYATPEQDLLKNLEISRKENDLAAQTSTLIALGDLKQKDKDFALALDYYKKAYLLSETRDHKNDQVFIAVAIGNVLDLNGEIGEALNWYNTALETAGTSAAKQHLSHIHNNLGNLYMKIGSFPQSLKHYQNSLDIKREQGDSQGIANALMNMSIFYLRTGNYGRSLEYQNQALPLLQSLGDKPALASIYNSISVCYRNLEDYDKAFEYNRKALKLYQELGKTAKVASSYNNLGVLYLAIGDLHQARENYLKSYEQKRGSQDMQSILSSLVNLADISLKLQQYEDTRRYLKQAREVQSKTQFYDLSRTLFKIHADFYEETKNYHDALQYFKAYHAISDSLSNVQKLKQLQELETKYELREKEKNIELLTRNNELSQLALQNSSRLRNYLIIIIALILLISLILIWLYTSVLRLSRQLFVSREKLNTLNHELEKRVETEVDRRRQQEQKALRQSRLALLGELAAGIAHELNQPMQTLYLTLENIKLSILDNSFDSAYLEQKLAYLFEDITRMQDVIEHIRCFSKSGEEDAEQTFDLNTSLVNAAAMVKERFGQNGMEIICHQCPENPLIFGNPYKFEHVILNLLTNARDAILENMEAAIIHRGMISISAESTADMAKITISDNGCGIAPEIQDKIYDIFFSTKSLEKGTGLGLAIALGIIRSMNASISFDSIPAQGSSFRIVIPVANTQSSPRGQI